MEPGGMEEVIDREYVTNHARQFTPQIRVSIYIQIKKFPTPDARHSRRYFPKRTPSVFAQQTLLKRLSSVPVLVPKLPA